MRNEKPIIQKRQSFRTAITKNKNWQKIRQRRPQMAGNTPTFVLVMWYNIDVIRWMPQRFLCAVNCIHSKETFSQTKRQFSDHQQIAWVIRTEIKLQASEFRWYEPWKQNIPGYRYVDPWKERTCGGATMAKAGAIHAAHEPARRSRHAMIFMGVKDTSSRPPDDWGGVPAMCDSRGRQRQSGAMMWFRKSQPVTRPAPELEPAGGWDKYSLRKISASYQNAWFSFSW